MVSVSIKKRFVDMFSKGFVREVDIEEEMREGNLG